MRIKTTRLQRSFFPHASPVLDSWYYYTFISSNPTFMSDRLPFLFFLLVLWQLQLHTTPHFFLLPLPYLGASPAHISHSSINLNIFSHAYFNKLVHKTTFSMKAAYTLNGQNGWKHADVVRRYTTQIELQLLQLDTFSRRWNKKTVVRTLHQLSCLNIKIKHCKC